MDYSKKTRQELIELCKSQKIRGYSTKNKDGLISLLSTSMEIKSKKDLGQYFTQSDELQKWVFDKVQNKGAELLEPSFGAGHLLKPFLEYNNSYKVSGYELDTSIKPVIATNSNQKLEYGDFTKQEITKKFKTIIGNPPYIKQKGTSNLYIKFIELCVNLLDTNGELVFIVPSDFIKLTSASKLIEKMTKEGSFTDFYFPNNENLFEDASIDVLCFRYEKNKISKTTLVNGEEKFCLVRNGIITFSDSEKQGQTLEEDFNVYVGIVSGKDEVYKVEYGNIEVLTDKDKVENFIYITEFPSGDSEIDEQLESNKEALMERKIRKFTEKNWFEWGAPRNIQTINANLGKPCIYVRNMTRQKDVAFKGKVQYFGGTLLCLIPKTNVQLDEVVKKLNSDDFKKDYMYAGRFKIGHKQLCNVCL
jgi:adenine-specific DNA-methyltransferase